MNKMKHLSSGPYSQMYRKKEHTQITISQITIWEAPDLYSMWSNHSEQACTESCSHVLVDIINSVLTRVFSQLVWNPKELEIKEEAFFPNRTGINLKSHSSSLYIIPEAS